MNPQDQYQGNNYDFIMNAGQKPKKTLVPKMSGGSFAGKLAVILGGAFILIIAMWFVGNLLGGGGVNTATIISLIQDEQEVARVGAMGSTSGDGNIRNASANITYTINTQQKEWVYFLTQHGGKIKEDQFALKQNQAADQRLAEAKANNTFDLTFKQIMNSYLTDYSNTLSAQYDKTTDQDERALLTSHYNEVKLLLQQLPD